MACAASRRLRREGLLNSIGGFRNEFTFVLTGLDIEAKAELVAPTTEALTVTPAEIQWTLARTDHPDAGTEETASAAALRRPRPRPGQGRARLLRTGNRTRPGQLPGFHATAPPGDGQVYGVSPPGYADRRRATHRGPPDGTRVDIPAPTDTRELVGGGAT